METKLKKMLFQQCKLSLCLIIFLFICLYVFETGNNYCLKNEIEKVNLKSAKTKPLTFADCKKIPKTLVPSIIQFFDIKEVLEFVNVCNFTQIEISEFPLIERKYGEDMYDVKEFFSLNSIYEFSVNGNYIKQMAIFSYPDGPQFTLKLFYNGTLNFESTTGATLVPQNAEITLDMFKKTLFDMFFLANTWDEWDEIYSCTVFLQSRDGDEYTLLIVPDMDNQDIYFSKSIGWRVLQASIHPSKFIRYPSKFIRYYPLQVYYNTFNEFRISGFVYAKHETFSYKKKHLGIETIEEKLKSCKNFIFEEGITPLKDCLKKMGLTDN